MKLIKYLNLSLLLGALAALGACKPPASASRAAPKGGPGVQTGLDTATGTSGETTSTVQEEPGTYEDLGESVQNSSQNYLDSVQPSPDSTNPIDQAAKNLASTNPKETGKALSQPALGDLQKDANSKAGTGTGTGTGMSVQRTASMIAGGTDTGTDDETDVAAASSGWCGEGARETCLYTGSAILALGIVGVAGFTVQYVRARNAIPTIGDMKKAHGDLGVGKTISIKVEGADLSVKVLGSGKYEIDSKVYTVDSEGRLESDNGKLLADDPNYKNTAPELEKLHAQSEAYKKIDAPDKLNNDIRLGDSSIKPKAGMDLEYKAPKGTAGSTVGRRGAAIGIAAAIGVTALGTAMAGWGLASEYADSCGTDDACHAQQKYLREMATLQCCAWALGNKEISCGIKKFKYTKAACEIEANRDKPKPTAPSKAPLKRRTSP